MSETGILSCGLLGPLQQGTTELRSNSTIWERKHIHFTAFIVNLPDRCDSCSLKLLLKVKNCKINIGKHLWTKIITVHTEKKPDLSEIWILSSIIIVSEHSHCLQVLCNVGQLFCLSSWNKTKSDYNSFNPIREGANAVWTVLLSCIWPSGSLYFVA